MNAAPFRLLLLEDSEDDALLVQAALAEHAPGEFTITWVELLADALARIGAEPFDLALCDLNLPDAKGLDTAQAVLDRVPTLPLVVLTGGSDEETGREAIRRGAQDFLVKGESGDAVIARTLRYAIERKRLQIGLRAANEALEQRVTARTAELEAANRKLAASERRFRELAELASDWYWEQDEQFRFTWFSEGAMAHTGSDMAEYLGKTRKELPIDQVSEEQWAGHRRNLEAHLPFRDFQYRWTDSRGERRDFCISGRPVIDEQGAFRGYRGVGSDITKRKQAERALARQKDLYSALSQTSEAIVRIENRDELFKAVCRIAVEHGRFRFAWIGLLDEDDQQIKPVAKFGEDAGYVSLLRISPSDSDPSRRGITGQVFRSGRHGVSNEILNDPVTAPWHEAARRAGVRAMASFPLRLRGAVTGVFNVYAQEPGFFTDDLIATLNEIAEDVSFALDIFEHETERERAAQALHSSEARYRSLFDNMLNGYAYCRMLYDDRGRPVDFVYLSVNHAFGRLTGLDDVVGRRVTEVFPGIRELNPELFDIYGRVASTGVPEAFEIDFKPLGKWMSIAVYGPEKGHFVAIFEDTTAAKQAQQALQASEEKYHGIYNSLQDVYVELALDGTILEISPQVERLSKGQYKREDLLGKKASLLYADPRHKEDIARALSQRGSVIDIEAEFRNRDGSIVPCSISAKVSVDAAGAPKGIVATLRDITERRLAERKLVEAEAQFRTLVEQSFTGIYIIQDGKFAYVNPRFVEILGYSSGAELIGLDPFSLTVRKDHAQMADVMRRLLHEGVDRVSYSLAALRRDGSSVELGVQNVRATYLGRPAILGMMQDISEKKRAEEQIKSYVTQLETAFMRTVEVATTISEMRDPYTAGHERRVAEIAVAIGAELGMEKGRLEGLRVAGYLHDIGKITIPAEILSKPGKLSALEFQLLKRHAEASYDVLKDVGFPWPVAEIALQHHERVDGSGYPRGLKGDATLLEARILAVADTLEAMGSHRPYRPAFGIDAALAEIERGRGTSYDPAVADACLRLFREKGYILPA